MAIKARRENLTRTAVEAGTKHDTLTVGSEPSGTDVSRTKEQSAEFRDPMVARQTSEAEYSCRGKSRRDENSYESGLGALRRGPDWMGRLWSVRQRLDRKCKVARALKSPLGLLLQATPDNALQCRVYAKTVFAEIRRFLL